MDKNKLAVSTYRKMAQKYTDAYFDDTSDFAQIDRFLNLLPPDGLVLDIGSGPGNGAKHIKESGFRVIGIDLTPEMIEIAKEKAPGIEFESMDMRDLKFSDNKFDGLLVAYSLIHIPTEEVLETLKGFRRILKPGGYALIIVQKGEPDKMVDEPLAPGEQMFFNFFTENRLSDLLKEAEFEMVFLGTHRTTDELSMSDSIVYTIARKQ